MKQEVKNFLKEYKTFLACIFLLVAIFATSSHNHKARSIVQYRGSDGLLETTIIERKNLGSFIDSLNQADVIIYEVTPLW